MKLIQGFQQENYSKTALKLLWNCSETSPNTRNIDEWVWKNREKGVKKAKYGEFLKLNVGKNTILSFPPHIKEACWSPMQSNYLVDNIQKEWLVEFLLVGMVAHDFAHGLDEIVKTDLPDVLLHVLHLTETQVTHQHGPQTILQEFPAASNAVEAFVNAFAVDEHRQFHVASDDIQQKCRIALIVTETANKWINLIH